MSHDLLTQALQQRIEALEDKVEGILDDETPLLQKVDELRDQLQGEIADCTDYITEFDDAWQFRELDAADKERVAGARIAALEKLVKMQGNQIAVMKLRLEKVEKRRRSEGEEEDEQPNKKKARRVKD